MRLPTRLNPAVRAGARAGLPFAVAAFLVGISFGVLAEPVMGSGAALVMSTFVFAGSAQFGSTAVLASGGGALAAIVAGVLLNARYIPMGIAIAPSLKGGWLRRAAYGEAMIDASWAMANRGDGRYDPDFMAGATLPSFPAWVAGTAVGLFGGNLIGDPQALGLDVMFPAFFLALLVNELRHGRALAAMGFGVASALILMPVTPAGVPVIVASAAALIGLLRGPGSGPEPPPRDPWTEAEEGP